MAAPGTHHNGARDFHGREPEGTVVQVVQAGFSIGDRVLRPAMVGVAKGGPKGPVPEGGIDKSV